MVDFTGSHFEKEIILWEGRWYVSTAVSNPQLEERRQERGVAVNRATLNRWCTKYGATRRAWPSLDARAQAYCREGHIK